MPLIFVFVFLFYGENYLPVVI